MATRPIRCTRLAPTQLRIILRSYRTSSCKFFNKPPVTLVRAGIQRPRIQRIGACRSLDPDPRATPRDAFDLKGAVVFLPLRRMEEGPERRAMETAAFLDRYLAAL